MAVQETILQHWIVTQFILPFALIFFILFGILQKTKLFGDAKQLNAMLSFVVGLVFVAAVFPKLVVENLILFLTVAIVVVFVALLLWGFLIGEEPKFSGKLKFAALGVAVVAVIIATLWATGVDGSVFDWLFRQSWSAELWTNIAFIAVIILAFAVIVRGK